MYEIFKGLFCFFGLSKIVQVALSLSCTSFASYSVQIALNVASSAKNTVWCYSLLPCLNPTLQPEKNCSRYIRVAGKHHAGARLTAYELVHDKLSATLIADSAAASLMAAGKVDAVVVGADRVTACGDTANKVGTYSLAVIAARHKCVLLRSCITS